jgi:myo-inositol-1(or 4)-monophosphatase
MTGPGGHQSLHGACVAAAEAGAGVLRALFHKPREIAFKGRIDLVTDADRAAEEAVLRVLGEREPGVRILAEESGAHGSSGEARFIVDPLDGTTNYAHGIPLFACTVAAEVSGAVVAACTIDPLRGEVFHGARGSGAFVRFLQGSSEQRLRASAAQELSQAVVCTGFPYDRRDKLPAMIAAFGRFTELTRGTRRLGSAALDLAYVAAGRFDGFWEQGLKPWDVAAGQLLVEEAGGLVTRYDGAPHSLTGGEILAAGAGLHAAMVQVLRG